MPAKPITEEQTEKVKNLRGKMTAQQVADFSKMYA